MRARTSQRSQHPIAPQQGRCRKPLLSVVSPGPGGSYAAVLAAPETRRSLGIAGEAGAEGHTAGLTAALCQDRSCGGAQGEPRGMRGADVDIASTLVAGVESSGGFRAAASLIKLLWSCSRNEFAPLGQLLSNVECSGISLRCKQTFSAATNIHKHCKRSL